MMIYSKRQMSDTFLIAVLLAVVGGSLDAYSYVARGHVFANAQTGNIVLFGLHLADGEWMQAGTYIIPVLAFVLGIFIDEWIKKFISPLPKVHWRQIVLLFEIAMLSIVAWLPFGERHDIVANVLVSFVCSMQVQSFRKVHGPMPPQCVRAISVAVQSYCFVSCRAAIRSCAIKACIITA